LIIFVFHRGRNQKGNNYEVNEDDYHTFEEVEYLNVPRVILKSLKGCLNNIKSESWCQNKKRNYKKKNDKHKSLPKG